MTAWRRSRRRPEASIRARSGSRSCTSTSSCSPKAWWRTSRGSGTATRTWRRRSPSLKEAKAHGVDTIVDLTVLGLGRDVATVREIAQASGMQVIVATGLYTYDALPHYFASRGPDAMARPVRAGHRAGDPGHGHPRGHPQVRDRRAGRDGGRREGAARRRAGAPPHRHADFDAHACEERAGAAAAGRLRAGRRRPGARRHRSQRRQRRHRLSGEADRARLVHRHGPLRHRPRAADGEARRHDRQALRARARRTGWCCRTTRAATSTGSSRR